MTGAAGCCWEDPMEPLFAIGPGLLAWPASPLWFARPGKPERFMTWATKITERFTSGHRANSEDAMVRTVFPDAVMLAGALALLAAVIALPLWG